MKDQVYVLTETGKKIDPGRLRDQDAARSLNYMRENRRLATENELEIAGGRHSIRTLVSGGYIRKWA